MKALKILAFLFMTFFTLTIWFPEESLFFFAGGSVGSMMDVLSTNKLLVTLFLVVEFGLLFFLLQKNKLLNRTLFALFFVAWFLSGRTIGVSIFPHGTVVTGWFFLPLNTFYLCDSVDSDCQTTVYKTLELKKQLAWNLELEVNGKKENFFVGPFLWRKGHQLFMSKTSNEEFVEE